MRSFVAKTSAILGIWIVLSVSSWARLGETLDQLKGRYGMAIRQLVLPASTSVSGDDRFLFRKTGFEINVVVLQGVSAKEIFHKSNGEDLQPEEVQTLLAANAQAQIWKPLDAVTWQRADGAQAVLKSNKYLTVQTKASVEMEAAAVQAARATSLEGF